MPAELVYGLVVAIIGFLIWWHLVIPSWPWNAYGIPWEEAENMEDLKTVQRFRDRNTQLLLEAGRLLDELEDSEQSSAATAELAIAVGHLAETEKALEKRTAMLLAENDRLLAQ